MPRAPFPNARRRGALKSRGEKLAEKYGEGGLLFVPVDLLGDKSVGARIRMYRNRLGLSQAELADECDLSQSTISRLETNPESVRLADFGTVCRALGITIADLVEGEVKRVRLDRSRAAGKTPRKKKARRT